MSRAARGLCYDHFLAPAQQAVPSERAFVRSFNDAKQETKTPHPGCIHGPFDLCFRGGLQGVLRQLAYSSERHSNTVTLSQGQSQQLKAEATFSDNSSSDVTNSAIWSSSNGCAVSVSAQTLGDVTAVGSGGAVTITATYNGVTGSATATAPTGITVSPCGTFTHGTSQQFDASFGGTDVTSSTTWTSSNTSIVDFANPASNLATFGPQTGTATITATTSSATGSLEITVQ